MTRRRTLPPRTDQQVRDHPPTMALLRAIAAGRVRPDRDRDPRAIVMPQYLDGGMVDRITLVLLSREDLIWLPIGGVPTLAPRGEAIVREAKTR